MNKIEELARLKLSARRTKDLIKDLILTGKMIENKTPDSKIYTVRGWILDEIERRDQEGYDRWIDSDLDDDGLLQYIKC